MKNTSLVLAAAVAAVPVLYLGILWPSLPANVPLHFTFNGAIERYGSKQDVAALVGALSVVNVLVYVILKNLHRLSQHAPAANKERMQKIALAVLLFLTGVQCWLLYVIQKGTSLPSLKFFVAGMCLFFAIIGNYMPNLKPNYFAGFRLPWTLNNETNWRKTHYVAGRLWFAGGLACMLLCLLLPLQNALVVIGFIFLLLLLLPAWYSYQLFKHAK